MCRAWASSRSPPGGTARPVSLTCLGGPCRARHAKALAGRTVPWAGPLARFGSTQPCPPTVAETGSGKGRARPEQKRKLDYQKTDIGKKRVSIRNPRAGHPPHATQIPAALRFRPPPHLSHRRPPPAASSGGPEPAAAAAKEQSHQPPNQGPERTN
jgi:hypothetical protein